MKFSCYILIIVSSQCFLDRACSKARADALLEAEQAKTSLKDSLISHQNLLLK